MSEYSLTATFENLTEAQALALEAMFERWELDGRIGASRAVAFMVDGDGNFHPGIEVESDARELSDEYRDAAEVDDNYFDFDGVAWELREDDEE